MRIVADWLTAPATVSVMAALEARAPGGSRFVGGCVRNAVLGLPADDIDIATRLRPDAAAAAAQAAGLSVVPTGVEHGTITIIAEHRPFEVTTLRRDVQTDGRRAVVAFSEDWAEDAQRRDFRLNALYSDPDGLVHDPTGGGLADAAAGRIIFIGEAEARIREDYLRILRFFRFSAWYAKGPLDEAGLAACARLRDGIAGLSVERVWKELKKLLAAADPAPALAAMRDCGVLAAVAAEFGAGARGFAMLAMGEAPRDPLLRAGALLPDDPDAARAFARRLKLANAERDRLTAALAPGPDLAPPIPAQQLRAALYRRGAEAVRGRLWLNRAMAVETADPGWDELLNAIAAWRRPSLGLSGEAIVAAGAQPGPMVGRVMRAVEEAWIAADFPNDSEWLQAALARSIAEQRGDGQGEFGRGEGD